MICYNLQMNHFKETTHLSEIIEQSDQNPVIIFKYSNNCNSSSRLYKKLEKMKDDGALNFPIYLVTVQVQSVLSKKIEEHFEIKHQSPQIIILNKRKVVYNANHNSIKTEDFIFT